MYNRKSFLRLAQDWVTSPQAAYFLGEPFFWILGLDRNRHDANLSQVNQVLVVRVENGIGDMVMTTPFLRELRRNLPGAWITLLVEPQIYNMGELCPYVNETLAFDWKVFGRYENLRRHGRALRLACKHLWSRHFDLAILPRWDFDYCHGTFVAYFSGAPLRLAYSENVNENKARMNAGFNRLYTHVLDDNSVKHEVERNLDIIRFIDGTVQEDQLEMWLGSEDEAFAGQVLASHEVCAGDLLIAFGVGAGEPKRMWPITCFAELGEWLQREYHARILLVGGKGEEKVGEELRRQLGDTVIDVVGRSTLRQTSSLLKGSHLYVGNDSGPMHLAAAAGVPVVEISCHPLDGSALHPNSPKRFRPWGVPHHVIQPEKALAPCSEACMSVEAHCILGIRVERVKEAVAKLL